MQSISKAHEGIQAARHDAQQNTVLLIYQGLYGSSKAIKSLRYICGGNNFFGGRESGDYSGIHARPSSVSTGLASAACNRATLFCQSADPRWTVAYLRKSARIAASRPCAAGFV